MKLRTLLLITLASGVHMASAAPAMQTPVGDPSMATVIATVNGKNITEWTLERYAQQRNVQQALTSQLRKALIEELVNRELIYQDAVSLGMDKTPLIEAEMDNARINIVASSMLNRSSDRFDVPEADLKKEYEARKEELGGQEVKARHILLENEADAKAVIAELDKGAKFAELAGKRSTDPSAVDGGNLGWFKPAQVMPPPFADAVAKLEKGTYTKTPVQTQYGWHVILLEDTRKVDPPPFDSVKEQIRVALQNKLIEKYIGELRAKAKISQP